MKSATRHKDISAADIIQDLDRLKLLIVFDALLVEGSLGRAAQKLGKTPSATSRTLRQLRQHYDQEIFHRTSKGMVPTAFAETLRPRIRALVSEANALLYPGQGNGMPRDPLLSHAPLALNQWNETGPDATELARRLADSSHDTDPARRFAGYIAMIGNASGQTRPMTRAEAEDAFDILLSCDIAKLDVSCSLAGFNAANNTLCRNVSVNVASIRFNTINDCVVLKTAF